MSSNKNIKDNMIRKYGKKCFIEELGLRTRDEIEQDLKKYNKSKRKELMTLTFHHIRERQAGGAASEENGAILRNVNHIWFNRLPKKEQARINKLFQEYKAQDKFIEFRDRIKVRTGVIQAGKVTPDPEIKIALYSCTSEEYEKYIKLRRERERAKPRWQGRGLGRED